MMLDVRCATAYQLRGLTDIVHLHIVQSLLQYYSKLFRDPFSIHRGTYNASCISRTFA